MVSCIGLEELRTANLWKAALAELIGTMFLTFIGCGTCIGEDWEKAPTTVQISLSFGLIVATMVWNFGNVSGGHINPAVTVAFLVTKRISVLRSVLYILAQIIGAIFGAGMLAGVSNNETWGTLGLPSIDSHLTRTHAFFLEMLITSVLVFTVFASCDKKRSDLNGSIPLTIGFSVTVCHLFAIKYTGSSMNPARAFGPAVILGMWPVIDKSASNSTIVSGVTENVVTAAPVFIDSFDGHWVYWLGPIFGGIVAAMLYEFLFAANASLERTTAMLTQCPFDRQEDNANDSNDVAMSKV
jgi:aquaporin-4